MVRAFNRLAAPLYRRVRLMVSRGVLNRVDDAKKLQEVQLGLLAGEVRDKVERVQDYGFSSCPHAGAEAVVVCVGGSRDHAVCIRVDDRRYRVQGMSPGEVALYTDEGDCIELKRGRRVRITTSSLEIAGPDGGSAEVTIKADLNIDGNVSATGSIIDGGGNEPPLALIGPHGHPDRTR